MLVTALAWVYTLGGAGMSGDVLSMPAQEATLGGRMMRHMAWSPAHAMLVYAMWSIMMVAMMTPSAAPMVLLYAAVNRKRQTKSRIPTAIFLSGYLAIWALFSVAATLLQWLLESTGLLTPLMASANPVLGSVILLAAGLYQLSPLKAACLRHCQNPVRFLTKHWRSGAGGAFIMGIDHGAYCLGCCWFLMTLLFFGGVMNTYWIAGLSIYVALEKFLRHGFWLGRAVGFGLTTGGILLLSQAF